MWVPQQPFAFTRVHLRPKEAEPVPGLGYNQWLF
jgi:hypothetical protein